MTSPADYRFIRHWETYMGSIENYIIEQQYYAMADGAPLTAIYKRPEFIEEDPNKGWRIIEDITSHVTRQYFIDAGLMTTDWRVK